MVPGGLPHPRACPQGQGRRVAPRHGQESGARVDGPGAAAGWRPTRHPWRTGVAHKSPDTGPTSACPQLNRRREPKCYPTRDASDAKAPRQSDTSIQ